MQRFPLNKVNFEKYRAFRLDLNALNIPSSNSNVLLRCSSHEFTSCEVVMQYGCLLNLHITIANCCTLCFVWRSLVFGKKCICDIYEIQVYFKRNQLVRVGVGVFLSWWSPSTMWADHFIFSSATTGDVWLIPSFRIWVYVLYVEYVSCVITNWDQHQWVIHSHLPVAL